MVEFFLNIILTVRIPAYILLVSRPLCDLYKIHEAVCLIVHKIATPVLLSSKNTAISLRPFRQMNMMAS